MATVDIDFTYNEIITILTSVKETRDFIVEALDEDGITEEEKDTLLKHQKYANSVIRKCNKLINK